MEKGIVFNIQKFSLHDGPGIRTTVFLKGCPLRCPWCHNPEGLEIRPEVAYTARKCIGCGGCNTVCITCSCFDTTDIIYNETSRDGERRRVWSSCMLNDYSTVAGGHNVRAKAGDRMRFKAMHKLYDYNARFGKGNMCVGCGRCDMRCPKDIHFSETIDKLAAAVENLKKGEN